ncbi:MAG: 3-methyl-2-oxobutanoate dehydrogenase subunit VorB [Proteobacteria bacterium]|nr:3-methyl-2-oxobutanoate dehydrogenase subunit VorB [Pseudomonadota bacterium]
MRRAFLKGNDAVICGALSAGCRAFFGYPITPASEIAHDAMRYFPEAGAHALQAESEIAAINMLYGAGASGVPAMTATSGPGFSLMQEGISYMAAARLPGVIVDVMRSGPGLGNIGPEQGDYFQAVYGGGHGHYHTPVLAPASVQEMFEMTRDAFRIAFEYATPVIVLADAFVGQMMESIDLPDDLPDASEIASIGARFENAITGEPATMGRIASSLELTPSKCHEKNDIRWTSYERMADIARAEIDETPDADLIVVAYGICARIAHDAVCRARTHGKRISFMRPQTLWPWPKSELRRLITPNARILVIECNRGMMTLDIERIAGEDRVSGLYTDGGLIPESSEILAHLVA